MGRRDSNPVTGLKGPEPRTMACHPRGIRILQVRLVFSLFSSSVGIKEKMEKYLIARTSTLNLLGDYFVI